MKTILHSDYWAEVPAGDFFAGLSPQNEDSMMARMQQQFSTDFFPYWKKRLLEDMPGLNLAWRSIYLDRFYIARFPVTWDQMAAFHKVKTVDSLPGFDSLGDFQAIELGYDLWEQHGAWITSDQFMQTLNRYHSVLEIGIPDVEYSSRSYYPHSPEDCGKNPP